MYYSGGNDWKGSSLKAYCKHFFRKDIFRMNGQSDQVMNNCSYNGFVYLY